MPRKIGKNEVAKLLKAEEPHTPADPVIIGLIHQMSTEDLRHVYGQIVWQGLRIIARAFASLESALLDIQRPRVQQGGLYDELPIGDSLQAALAEQRDLDVDAIRQAVGEQVLRMGYGGVGVWVYR